MTEYIDIGANLGDKSFAKDLDDVVERAQAVGVRSIVITGTSAQRSETAAELAATRPGFFYCTAGVHPHDAKQWDDTTESRVKALLDKPQVVAVGECGLDFNRDFSPRPKQIEAFRAQLELACERDLPVFVHERDAAQDTIAILREFRPRLEKIVVHCFTGIEQTLRAYLELDLYIGITGWICDERRGQHLHPLLELIPEDRLMIETDAPYLLPRSIRPRPKSRRNEPAFITHVADTIAELKGQNVSEIAASTTRVARHFFGLAEA